MLSLGVALAVGTGDHDHVAIGIAEPKFPMLRRGVDVRTFDNLSAQAISALHRGVKIPDLEPQHDAVPDRRRSSIDEIGVFFLVPGVQLKKQATRA
jgi:hypothetical protein